MKCFWTIVFGASAAVTGLANGAARTTGVSVPPSAIIATTSEDATTTPPLSHAKPSAAITTAAPALIERKAALSTASAQDAKSGTAQAAATMLSNENNADPDAQIVTSVSTQTTAPDDSGVITSVSSPANEVPAGTILRTKIRETLSTASTPTGTKFNAEVTVAMEQGGRVIIPVGSIVKGRVTEVRGGKRVRGAAALHLQPESVTLPDGTYYPLHAQVFDTSQYQATKVDHEGTILRKDHIGATLAAMSLTTGGAAATGAVLGGGVGALVGAGVGAGVSTVWWLKQDRQEVIPANTGITFGLVAPLTITPMTMGTR